MTRRVTYGICAFLVVAALAAIPSFGWTALRLYELGAPPTITLEDGRVIGETTVTQWPGTFVRALFEWDPPTTFRIGLVFAPLNALVVTAGLVLAALIGGDMSKRRGAHWLLLEASIMPVACILWYEWAVGSAGQSYAIDYAWKNAMITYGIAVTLVGVAVGRTRLGEAIAS